MPFHLCNSSYVYAKNYEKSMNNNYIFQRQLNLQSRENKRKIEYERIQKENVKFSQKLINAKPFHNRYEQQIFFDKHCQIKQHLKRYPNLNRIQRKVPYSTKVLPPITENTDLLTKIPNTSNTEIDSFINIIEQSPSLSIKNMSSSQTSSSILVSNLSNLSI
ncbi:unnamed protein product [Adineta steineri]|uniref:Uncharacterized protein n=1 Tax=Adineta steineri TaxID=433720 RepID=A0A813TZB7_9BILA|nr:unnamed protein product [Adineta steineri]CAF1583787.1 unnamed protein product [Adineta steineri]